jgi:hypothetical protein
MPVCTRGGQNIPLPYKLPNLGLQLVTVSGVNLFWSRTSARECPYHVLLSQPASMCLSVSPLDICAQTPRGSRWTPYLLGSSASVIASRIASSAIRALNSRERVLRYALLDRHFHHAIYLESRSELPPRHYLDTTAARPDLERHRGLVMFKGKSVHWTPFPLNLPPYAPNLTLPRDVIRHNQNLDQKGRSQAGRYFAETAAG